MSSCRRVKPLTGQIVSEIDRETPSTNVLVGQDADILGASLDRPERSSREPGRGASLFESCTLWLKRSNSRFIVRALPFRDAVPASRVGESSPLVGVFPSWGIV